MNSLTDPSSSYPDSALWTLTAQPGRHSLLLLQGFLSDHRQHPVRIEVGGLRRPDTLLLQLIAAACRDWAGRGLPFRLTGLPERLGTLLPILGLKPDMIGIEVR